MRNNIVYNFSNVQQYKIVLLNKGNFFICALFASIDGMHYTVFTSTMHEIKSEKITLITVINFHILRGMIIVISYSCLKVDLVPLMINTQRNGKGAT